MTDPKKLEALQKLADALRSPDQGQRLRTVSMLVARALQGQPLLTTAKLVSILATTAAELTLQLKKAGIELDTSSAGVSQEVYTLASYILNMTFHTVKGLDLSEDAIKARAERSAQILKEAGLNLGDNESGCPRG